MESPVELNELMERIRHAANRENGLAGGSAPEYTASSELPSVPEPLPKPPLPTRAAGGDATRPETLLDGAASMLRGGREKTNVAKGVPKFLRPLFRNQGGYNSVVLEAAERLVEVNRTLRQQNYELHERMMGFHAWAHSVAEISMENRAWVLAATARLQAFSEERWSHLVERVVRLENAGGQGSRSGGHEVAASLPAEVASHGSRQTEEQLARMSAHIEAMETERRALNDHLNRLRAQIAEQAEYIRTVHLHLDQLGAHVDATLARDRPV